MTGNCVAIRESIRYKAPENSETIKNSDHMIKTASFRVIPRGNPSRQVVLTGS